MKKRTQFGLLLVVCLCAGLAGCTFAGEKVLEGASGGNVNIEGDSIEFIGEDGEAVSVGGGDWPDSELGQKVPRFTGGTVNSAVSTDDGIMISMSEVDEAAIAAYFEQIKADFKENTVESTMDDLTTYTGFNADGVGVAVYYTKSKAEVLISISQQAKE